MPKFIVDGEFGPDGRFMIDRNSIQRAHGQPEIGAIGDRLRQGAQGLRERVQDRRGNRNERLGDVADALGAERIADSFHDRAERLSPDVPTKVAPGTNLQPRGKGMQTETVFFSDQEVNGAAGAADVEITIRAQIDAVLESISFEGSTAGALVKELRIGRKRVIDAPNGLPIALFKAESKFLEKILGQKVHSGLDIYCKIAVLAAGDVGAVTLVGQAAAGSTC